MSTSSHVHLPVLQEPAPKSGGELPVARDSDPTELARPHLLPAELLQAQLMQVGDLAQQTGKTVRAIHLYEQLDLLKPAARSKGRYRLYGPEALVRIRWISKLQELGFSLSDIKTILKDVEAEGNGASAPTAMVKVRAVYVQKLEETRTQIARLTALEGEILASLAYLDTCGSSCEPDRLLPACTTCDHHSERDVPDLVAGFHA
jgi:MerR family copper efflux transcriptional regulator